ncbi:Sodium/proline symporter, partial [Intoshia linei]
KMDVNIGGIISIIIFYLAIMGVGFWAARKSKKNKNESETEEIMVAGRNIGLIVGIFTMTATWVGGGYINGTAEVIYTSGLLWCQAPFGYAISLIIGGFFFAEKMRKEGYVTMLDPFQIKYGQRMGGLLYIPALLGEVFWSAAILAALGATLTVIINLDNSTSIIISACVAVVYTLFGGLYAVSYTDVLQLFCIFFGLWLSIPFSFTNNHVNKFSTNKSDWLGEIKPEKIASWIDSMLLLMFGGIPWQVYFQRVLSSKTAFRAKILSYVAAAGCIFMAIPAILVGLAAQNTRWSETELDPALTVGNILKAESHPLILPLVLQYLCPAWVSFIGLGAVSAAVMSSADSSILSASSMFTRNVYKLIFRQNAEDRELMIIMRFSILGIAAMATLMAITIESIYGLWYLCADLVYVILFPQLVCVVYIKWTNTYGSLVGYLVGILIRLLGGETYLSLPAVIKYPFYDDENKTQNFPFKTFSMLISFACILLVSFITNRLFNNKILDKKFDIFRKVTNISQDHIELTAANMTASRCHINDTETLKKSPISNIATFNPNKDTFSSIDTTKITSDIKMNIQ